MPKTIITYLIDGEPTGIKTVEFSNRLIKGIYIPRKDFKRALERDELKNSGVYLLLGEDEEGNLLAYIGQATILGKRLSDHYKDTNKDFWKTSIAFTYKDGTLNESDINFIERELINEAKVAGRYKIKNGNGGNNGLIQEYRISDMIEFINDLKILLESLGFKLFKKLVNNKELENEDNIYYLTARGSNAKGIYTNDGFIVLRGSKGPKELQEGVIKNKGYAFRNRSKLIEEGVIKINGNEIVFQKDYLFTSPSSAASFISGASLNGWLLWKNKKGITLDEIERN